MLIPGGHVEPHDRTLLAAALREVSERAGIAPQALCPTRQVLGSVIDIDVHDTDVGPGPSPGTREPAHRHHDIRYVFYLADEDPPTITSQHEEASGAQWLPLSEITSSSLRAKLLGARLDGVPEPVNASVLIHDGHGRYLLHLRDHKPGVIRQSGAFDLLGDRRGRGSAAGPSSWIPAPDDAYGYWLATARPAPGLVRDFQAETMTIATPAEGSWRSPVPARTLSASMGPGRGGPNSRTCTPAGSVPGCLMRTG